MSKRYSNARGNSIYAGLPVQASQVRTGDFAIWLSKQGATLLDLKSIFEIARWRGTDDPIPRILYKKGNGEVTWTIPTAEAYRAFLASEKEA